MGEFNSFDSKINYSELLLSAKGSDKADYIKSLALTESIDQFNKLGLIVPCKAKLKNCRHTHTSQIVFYTKFEFLNNYVRNSLKGFGLSFSFSNQRKGEEFVEVEITVKHKLGGKTKAMSKPTKIMKESIDGKELTYSECVSSAFTRAKKSVLTSSLLNICVDKDVCYKGKLVDLDAKDLCYISKEQSRFIRKAVMKKTGGIFGFKKYLKEAGIKNINEIRGYQFNEITNYLNSLPEKTRSVG